MKINKKLQDRIDILKNMIEDLFSDYSGIEIKEIEYSDGYHEDSIRVEFTIVFDWANKKEYQLSFDIGELDCWIDLTGEDNWEKIYVSNDSSLAIFGYEDRAIIWEELFMQAN